jgi:ABC-type transport system substrate-binding protein
MSKTKKFHVASFILIAVSVFISLSFTSVAAKKSSGILRVGIAGDPNNLAPNDNTSVNTKAIVRQIFETLIWPDESGKIQPRLAKSWEFTADNNIIFYLRKGVKFHDGTSFNAEAVKFSLERIKKEKLKASTMLPYLEKIEVIDQHTIKAYVTGQPSIALGQFGLAGWLESPAAVKKYGKDAGLHPVGTGPFKFVEWEALQKVVLTANENYWGGKPLLTGVEFKPITEAQTRSAMVESGDLDVAMTPPLTDIQRLMRVPGVKIDNMGANAIVYLCFNLAKSPMDNKKVRQAIAHAINRDGMVQTLLFRMTDTSKGFTIPELEYAKKYDIYPYSPKKAESILNGLGWKRGDSGYLEKNGKIFEFNLMTPVGRYPMDSQIAEAVQAMLIKIGIKANVTPVESGAFVKFAVSTDWEGKSKSKTTAVIGAFGRYFDLSIALTNIWHTSSLPPNGYNFFFFKNAAFDQTMDKSNEEYNQEKRKSLLIEAQDILYDELPMIPLYRMPFMLLMRDNVKRVSMPNHSNELQLFWDTHFE